MKAQYAVLAPAILSAVGVTVAAQDTAPPGFQIGFDVTQRLEYSDNPDFDADGDSDFYGRTIFGLRLDSVRKLDRFQLRMKADLEEGRDRKPTLDWTTGSGSVGYRRATRSAFIDTGASYSVSDVNSDDFDDDDFEQDSDIINQTGGTRTSYSFRLAGAVGQDAPVGASYNWNYRDISFSEGADPDLNDSSNNAFSGQIDFRISPRITVSLTAQYIDFDASGDGVDRETTGFGVATNLAVTSVDTINLRLSQDRIERSGGETGVDDGLSAGVDWARLVPNGSVGFSYASNVTSNDDGRRSSLRVNRSMELPRGALALAVGVTGSDTLGTDPLVDVNYQHDLPSARLGLGITQSVATNSDNDETINTTLRASYNYDINNLSSLGLSVQFRNRNELQDDSNDGRRLDINLSYRYDLTADWGLVGGYRYSLSKEDDEDDRSSNTVFIGLQRSFNWIP